MTAAAPSGSRLRGTPTRRRNEGAVKTMLMGASILSVLRRVREEGVTEAERQRALITAESAYAFDIETAEGLAKSYGQAETTWTLENELAYLSRLRETTAAEIQAAARKYLGDDNYARVRFVPQGGAR